jgi:hypothetical protein
VVCRSNSAVATPLLSTTATRDFADLTEAGGQCTQRRYRPVGAADLTRAILAHDDAPPRRHLRLVTALLCECERLGAVGDRRGVFAPVSAVSRSLRNHR